MLAVIGINEIGSQWFDFRFNAGGFGEDEIFEAATSPPSRYVIELGRRALAAMPSADWLLIGNPLLPFRSEHIAGWMAGSGPAVISDSADFPLAYRLPRRLFEDEAQRFLLPLSGVSAKLDAHLLTLLAGEDVDSQPTALPPVGQIPGPRGGVNIASQWILDSHQRDAALKWQCMNAIDLIKADDGWRRVPTTNFHPNHAGDVLFWSLASRRTDPLLYQRQIICWSYMEIAREAGHALELIRLPMPWLTRDPRLTNESGYFFAAMDRLGPEVTGRNFVIFNRFVRRYGHTTFHLIDHARFSLGDPMTRREDTVQHSPLVPDARCRRPAAPLRVLLHLSGGGWGLKNYPRPLVETLCRSLSGLGCQLSVIDGAGLEAFGAQPLVCDDIETLKAAVTHHHIMVGVDSFPHHFARHRMGWPTIGLFANTKPCNSDAARGLFYRAEMEHLPCNPCGGQEVCPAYGGAECHNFIRPQSVIQAIFEMAADVYGYAFV